MSRLLLISAGELTGTVLELMARRGDFDEIILASRSERRARAKANNARIGAAIEGVFPDIRGVAFDLNDPGAGAQLAALAPDVVFAAPSQMPWWALKRLEEPLAALTRAVPFAGFMAFHLAPMLALRKAWVASGLSCPWVGASYPDVVNHVLACSGPAPTCGVGNLLEAVPKVRFVAAEKLGVDPAAVSVKLIAQHAFEYYLYSDGNAGNPPPFLLEAKVNDRDITGEIIGALFAPCPIPYGLDLNLITASATCGVLAALAGETPVATHLPAPGGRLGGYPVTVSRQGVALDLAETWTLAQAEEVNRAALPWDGIADIDGNGVVTFTDKTAAALQDLLGRPVATLAPQGAGSLADELYAVLAKG